MSLNFSGHDLREENNVSEVSNLLELNNTVGVTDVKERNHEVSSQGRILIHIPLSLFNYVQFSLGEDGG